MANVLAVAGPNSKYAAEGAKRAVRGQPGIGLAVAVVLSAATACHSGVDSTRASVAKGTGAIEVDHVVPFLSWASIPTLIGPCGTPRMRS